MHLKCFGIYCHWHLCMTLCASAHNMMDVYSLIYFFCSIEDDVAERKDDESEVQLISHNIHFAWFS